MQHCEVEVDIAFSLVIQLEDDLGANKDIIGVIEKFVNKTSSTASQSMQCILGHAAFLCISVQRLEG